MCKFNAKTLDHQTIPREFPPTVGKAGYCLQPLPLNKAALSVLTLIALTVLIFCEVVKNGRPRYLFIKISQPAIAFQGAPHKTVIATREIIWFYPVYFGPFWNIPIASDQIRTLKVIGCRIYGIPDSDSIPVPACEV